MEFNYFHKNFVIKGLRDSKRDYELEVENFALSTFEDLKLKIRNYSLPDNWFLWCPSVQTLGLFKPRLSGTILDVESYILIDPNLSTKG